MERFAKIDYDNFLGGALTLKNGRIDKYQFDEGYCQAKRSNYLKDNFTFCYYDKDHLGNIRQVTEDDNSNTGLVTQIVNYYPFGMQLCTGPTTNNVQSHKYNGKARTNESRESMYALLCRVQPRLDEVKEFDSMHDLNTYDCGARQYNPVTARWDRMDPLTHEYYGISPYVYCHNNPVMLVDSDGRDIKFIEGTSKAFIEKYSMARQYLIENGCDQLIELFEKDKKLTLLIGERANGTSSGFSPNRNCIFVDLDKGITSTDSNGNRHFLSPAVVLIHEFIMHGHLTMIKMDMMKEHKKKTHYMEIWKKKE